MHPRLRDRYRLERLLSERDATTTHLAVDEARGRKVVIKTLFLKAATEEELRLFEREAALLETLSHPRVPRYVEHWVEESEGRVALHLVQDHVDGETLERLTRGGRRFSEEEVRRLGAELADVLAYLHALRPPVVHRDLKPSNVIVDERVRPHLIDFGAATAARPSVRTVVGTYGYMPPEQYEGRALPESDVYALGATLLFLLTHRHPWESDGGVRGLLAQAAMGESTRRILSALTAVAPEERPSAEEAAALLRGEGGDARTGLFVHRASRAVDASRARPRRHRWSARVPLLAERPRPPRRRHSRSCLSSLPPRRMQRRPLVERPWRAPRSVCFAPRPGSSRAARATSGGSTKKRGPPARSATCPMGSTRLPLIPWRPAARPPHRSRRSGRGTRPFPPSPRLGALSCHSSRKCRFTAKTRTSATTAAPRARPHTRA